jgi:hypothetical protein
MNSGRTSNTNILMSPQHIADCAQSTPGCAGGGDPAVNAAWYAATPARGLEEWCLPYKSASGVCNSTGCPLSRTFPAKDVAAFGSNIPLIQAELLLNGPLSISFVVHNSLFGYSRGVYTRPNATTGTVGGHAVMLVGWGTDGGVDYWKVQNSWGPGWGEKGMLRIRRGTNECDIETRGVNSFTPLPSQQCLDSPCANGSITLADCSCRCAGPLLGGALCDTIVNPCQNGGVPDQWRTSCQCQKGTNGRLCQYGFRVAVDNTASCAGTANYATIPYLLQYPEHFKSYLGVFTMTTTDQFNPISRANMCVSPGPCPLGGSLTLHKPSTLAAGRYRIILVPWVTSNGVSGSYALSPSSPVVAYHTVLPAGSSCTPAALQQAAAANSPAVNVTASLAAEEASLALMEPRLTAALGIKDQLRAVIASSEERQTAAEVRRAAPPPRLL